MGSWAIWLCVQSSNARRWMFKHPTPEDLFRDGNASAVGFGLVWRGCSMESRRWYSIENVAWYKWITELLRKKAPTRRKWGLIWKETYVIQIKEYDWITETFVRGRSCSRTSMRLIILSRSLLRMEDAYKKFMASLSSKEKRMLNCNFELLEVKYETKGIGDADLYWSGKFAADSSEWRSSGRIWRKNETESHQSLFRKKKASKCSCAGSKSWDSWHAMRAATTGREKFQPKRLRKCQAIPVAHVAQLREATRIRKAQEEVRIWKLIFERAGICRAFFLWRMGKSFVRKPFLLPRVGNYNLG